MAVALLVRPVRLLRQELLVLLLPRLPAVLVGAVVDLRSKLLPLVRLVVLAVKVVAVVAAAGLE